MSAALKRPPEAGRPGFQSATFRTLCGDCNSRLLGGIYDPELKRFCDQFATWVRGAADFGFVLPDTMRITCKPGAVARAVVGHLLAVDPNVHRPAENPPGTAIGDMKRFFLGEETETDSLELLFWPFPSAEHRIARGAGLASMAGAYEGPIAGDLLKFFPLAWWLVYRRPRETETWLSRLPMVAASTSQDILCRLRPAPRANWPEHPDKGEVLFFNFQHTSFVTKRGSKRHS